MKKVFLYLSVVAFAVSLPVATLAQYGGGGGGGYAPQTPPAVTPAPTAAGAPSTGTPVVLINGSADPAQVISSTEVRLGLPQTTGDQMAISNSLNFDNSSWVNYQNETDWTLTPGAGSKEVFVKFRDSSSGAFTSAYRGTSVLVLGDVAGSDSEVGAEPADSSIGSAGCALTPGRAYRATGSRGVYYVLSNCAKRMFMSAAVYFTYFNSWNDVIVTTEDRLNQVPDDAIRFMPWGPTFDPRYGAFVKVVDDPRVYLLLNGNKYWITSADVFNALYYRWEWIEDVDSRVLDRYASAGEVTDTTRHPEHTIIKYEGGPEVYRIENARKRHILNENVFTRLGYRFDRVANLPDGSFTYEDGESLE